MGINDIVKVRSGFRQGKIINTQKSTSSRIIYIVEFSKNASDGFFEEELELVASSSEAKKGGSYYESNRYSKKN